MRRPEESLTCTGLPRLRSSEQLVLGPGTRTAGGSKNAIACDVCHYIIVYHIRECLLAVSDGSYLDPLNINILRNIL